MSNSKKEVLVIVADCLNINSSANLCHIAYIKGLVSLGFRVSLLHCSPKWHIVDGDIDIPEEVVVTELDAISLYQKYSNIKKKKEISKNKGSTVVSSPSQNRRGKGIGSTIKKKVLSFYGIYNIYSTFIRKAKKYSSEIEFDFVISLSSPDASHMVAYNLIKSKKIKCLKWIQIWEDPWSVDIYGINDSKKAFREERKLLSYAQHICYVSPLTLQYQKQFFPESSDKMYWQPLPYYYKSSSSHMKYTSNSYGYFGDYFPAARDLLPFYEAAKKTGIEVNICGNPCNLFQSTMQIHIHPRLPLNELKPLEDSTGVLVFLCNRKGGQIPGKIYQYSATNKTILFIMDGTEEEQQVLKEYFGKFNRYVFCQNTVADIAEAIRRIEAGNLGDVQNVPLNEFDPVKTITNILEAAR